MALLDHHEYFRNRRELPRPRRVEAEARSRSGVDPQSETSSKSDSFCIGLPLPFFAGRSLRMKFLEEPSESSPSSTNTSQRSPANSSVSNSRSPNSCFAHFTRLLLGWSLRESQASIAIVSPLASTSNGTSSFSPNFVSRSSTWPISAGYQPSSMIVSLFGLTCILTSFLAQFAGLF